MNRKYIALVAVLCCVAISACRKKPLPGNPKDPDKPVVVDSTRGSLQVKVANMVGDKPIILFGKKVDTFLTAGGEKFTVNMYNYYISNIVLTDDKGNKFTEPESYHLVMSSDPFSLAFTIKDIPAGNYILMDFLIGVDSVRNFSGAQSGALDPKYGMIWSWSTGYIMAKMEGFSPAATNTSGIIAYHIAGYKGVNKVLRNVKLPFPQAVKISETGQPSVELQSDLLTWFRAPAFKDFATTPGISNEGPAAAAMADNYSSMFRITKVNN